MADEAGLYIHNGNGFQLQNAGVCKKQGDGSECEIYAYDWNNAAYKIYPREQSWSMPNGGNGGIGLITFRSNYPNTTPDRAMQGWYGGYSGGSGQQIGNIYWRGGKPSVPGTLVRVDRVRFEIYRNVNTGWYNQARTCVLHMSPETTGGSFSSQVGAVAGSPSFSFTWGVGGTSTVIDNNSGLNDFFYSFLSNGYYQSISLYNGESSGSGYRGEKFSTNYAGTRNVNIEIWATYQS